MSLVPDRHTAYLTVYDDLGTGRGYGIMSSVVVFLCMVIGLLVLKLVFGKGRTKSEKPLDVNAALFNDMRRNGKETTAHRDDRSTAPSGISWSSQASRATLRVNGFNKVLEFFADQGTSTRHDNMASRLRDIRINRQPAAPRITSLRGITTNPTSSSWR